MSSDNQQFHTAKSKQSSEVEESTMEMKENDPENVTTESQDEIIFMSEDTMNNMINFIAGGNTKTMDRNDSS